MRAYRAGAMANPEEAGPTPDSPERAAGSREPPPGGDQDTGWFGNLIKKTQKDAEETIKFIEEEHKKNVQKFEQAVDEIKHTAEEVVDSVQSQIEGRKSLKLLREERVRPVVVESSPSSPSSREISTRARARSRVALVLPSLRARSRTPRFERSSPLRARPVPSSAPRSPPPPPPPPGVSLLFSSRPRRRRPRRRRRRSSWRRPRRPRPRSARCATPAAPRARRRASRSA